MELYWKPQSNFRGQSSLNFIFRWYLNSFCIILLPFFVHRRQRNAAAFPLNLDILLENGSTQGDEIAFQDDQPLLEPQGWEGGGGCPHGQSVLLLNQHGETLLQLTRVWKTGNVQPLNALGAVCNRVNEHSQVTPECLTRAQDGQHFAHIRWPSPSQSRGM